MSQNPPPSRLVLPVLAEAGTDQLSLIANVRALECRVARRVPQCGPEVHILLQGAVNLAHLDAAKAKVMLDQARQVYTDALRMSNRGVFAVGALIGALLAMTITVGLIGLAGEKPAWAGHLAAPDMLFPLCSFALIGSLISIFARLPTMDLKDADSVVFVAFSAAIQPVTALGFMSIIYVLLHYEILGFKIASAEPNAVLWVTAFFCGFSERFAPGILGSASAALSRTAAAPPR